MPTMGDQPYTRARTPQSKLCLGNCLLYIFLYIFTIYMYRYIYLCIQTPSVNQNLRLAQLTLQLHKEPSTTLSAKSSTSLRKTFLVNSSSKKALRKKSSTRCRLFFLFFFIFLQLVDTIVCWAMTRAASHPPSRQAPHQSADHISHHLLDPCHSASRHGCAFVAYPCVDIRKWSVIQSSRRICFYISPEE